MQKFWSLSQMQNLFSRREKSEILNILSVKKCCICFLRTLVVDCVLWRILIFAMIFGRDRGVGGGILIRTFHVKSKPAYTSYLYCSKQKIKRKNNFGMIFLHLRMIFVEHGMIFPLHTMIFVSDISRFGLNMKSLD